MRIKSSIEIDFFKIKLIFFSETEKDKKKVNKEEIEEHKENQSEIDISFLT